MKIAYLSHNGDSLDLAFRMGLDGHSVIAYVEDPQDADNFDGIIPKAKTWQEAVKGKDLLVWDDNKIDPRIWQACHKDFSCFGGSPFAAQLEKDRAFAHALMDRCGIPRIESKTYKTLKEVIGHLKEHKQAHVVKPQGPEVKSHHLIVGDDTDNADAIGQVERLIEQKLPVQAVEVEERKRGVEVGLLFFFNGLDRVGPICISFEHKRSHDDEKGHLTGEMGTLIRYLEDDELPLYRDTLARIVPALRAAQYKGMIDINMIVGREPDTGDRFIAPLEFTSRIPKPMCFIQDELHVTPWYDIMLGCATGTAAELRVHYDWGVGVQLCAFGFPHREMEHLSKGLTIQGLDEHSLQHLHPIEAKLNAQGKFVVDSGVGEILCATGRGGTIQDAKHMAYDQMARVKVPNSFYRSDISDKISPWELEELGILPVEEGTVK